MTPLPLFDLNCLPASLPQFSLGKSFYDPGQTWPGEIKNVWKQSCQALTGLKGQSLGLESVNTTGLSLETVVPKRCPASSPPSTIYKQSSVTASKLSSVACHLWPCTHYEQGKQINSNLQIWKHMPLLLCSPEQAQVKTNYSKCVRLAKCCQSGQTSTPVNCWPWSGCDVQQI